MKNFGTHTLRRSLRTLRLTAWIAIAAAPAPVANAQNDVEAQAEPRTVLVVILDGLRPDYITPELMPNLHALAAEGVLHTKHHAVFPTVTRVNAASISTGAYPKTHGLMENTVYFPEVDPERTLSTSDRENLLRIDEATGGNLLTAPTLGETLQAAGRKLLVVSSGSSGSSFLLNHKVAGGAIIHHDYTLPESLAPRVAEVLGPVPADASPNEGRNRRAVDAYLKFGLDEIRPDVTLMWLSDPDHTAHPHGIGSERTVRSIRLVDGELGRIREEHRRRGMSVNVLVTADHGFSTHTGPGDLSKLLIENGLKESARSTDVVLAGGAIHVAGSERAKIRAIAELLLRTEWVGAVFMHQPIPTHPEGPIHGTLAFKSAQWNHARAADLLVSMTWSDEKNEHGYAGTTTQGGVAGHGSTSPFDIGIALIAAGPDFKSGLRSAVPTCNIDIAPTVCHLFGITPPDSMDGRVIRESLTGGPDPKSVLILERIYRSKADLGTESYQIDLFESAVDGTDYLDHTEIKRRPK